MSKEIFLRAADLHLEENRVVGRMVPYDEPATIRSDVSPVTGKREPFREVFRRHSLLGMIQGLRDRGSFAAISLNLDHEREAMQQIGYASDIEERDDGAWGVFNLYEGDIQIDKIKNMLRTSHDGMSVGFKSMRSRITGDLVEHLAVHVDHVAATPLPAYAGAGIVDVREDGTLDLQTPRLDALRADIDALRST